MACIMANEFVEQMLKSPATAEFEPCYKTKNAGKIIYDGDNGYTITSFVDSQNSFGALLRTQYVAQMRYIPSTEKWRLEDITTSED